ncbi:MetQ/NlpA family ABC transporter substrate-binding protein [Lacibacterium aquatile]|uniref:MetQ/NlpA family ABC transporter substrate-binding protein n=1 Tax=Lacibacterium aquatile TaxID=1168082 RepID=A0ABW5DMH2_9PROT
MKRVLLAGVAAALFALPAFAQSLKVGVTAGPHAEIFEKVAAIAKKDGVDIKVIEFSDYIQPNAALASGDLDLNSFQHQPYLDNQVVERKYDLVSVGKTVTYPIGVYSRKIKSLDELKEGAKIAIPNDPTNGGRVLLLLQSKGLLKLDPKAGLKATPLDVAENPKKLKFIELDAAQLPRSLDDVDLASINTNFAIEAGIDPIKDAIVREAPESPYANILVVRTQDKDKPWVAKVVKAYQSDEIRTFIQERFKGAVIASF